MTVLYCCTHSSCCTYCCSWWWRVAFETFSLYRSSCQTRNETLQSCTRLIKPRATRLNILTVARRMASHTNKGGANYPANYGAIQPPSPDQTSNGHSPLQVSRGLEDCRFNFLFPSLKLLLGCVTVYVTIITALTKRSCLQASIAKVMDAASTSRNQPRTEEATPLLGDASAVSDG